MEIAPEVAIPKSKVVVSRLRWEIKHKMTHQRRRPLTELELDFKKLQITAFDKLKAATGGRPFKVLKEKIDAVPGKTAEAVVKSLTSLDNTPGLSPEEQLQEDQLKVAVLRGRINKNAGVVVKRKGPKVFGGPSLKRFLTAKRSRREEPAPSASSSSSLALPAVPDEPSEEELKRRWFARERAAQEAQDKLQKQEEMDLRRRKKEWATEHRYDHQCLGCRKHFAWEEEYFEHLKKCNKYLNLPMDKFGFRRGEEPESPTLKKVGGSCKKDGHDFWI